MDNRKILLVHPEIFCQKMFIISSSFAVSFCFIAPYGLVLTTNIDIYFKLRNLFVDFFTKFRWWVKPPMLGDFQEQKCQFCS